MKINKIIMFIIVFMSIFVISANVYAFDIGKMFSDADNFVNKGNQNVKISDDELAEVVSPIAGILMTIGSCIIIGFGIVLGINYITGGPDKQADCKKQAIGLVFSAIVLWGAYGIWAAVYNLLSEM